MKTQRQKSTQGFSRWSGNQKRMDRPARRPDLIPFIVRIISEHHRRPAARLKRVQAIVKCLGVTRTIHIDVPLDFTV